MITFGDFSKLEIKIGTIKEAEKMEGSDKLIKLQVDLGNETRQLAAGIAEWYSPEDVIGKQIPILANLEPKSIRGIESQGMILAIEESNGNCVLLHPEKSVESGSKIR